MLLIYLFMQEILERLKEPSNFYPKQPEGQEGYTERLLFKHTILIIIVLLRQQKEITRIL